jgi:peptidoglycan/LPS O-acetylase OafA/YrhL
MADQVDAASAKRARKPFYLVQVLRGVAALLVVAHHSTILAVERLSVTGDFWRNGAAGVDVFFVISGFVMALSSGAMSRNARTALEFLKRRIERIVPLYWLMTTLKVAILLAVPAEGLNALGGERHIAASYFFLPSAGPHGDGSPVLVVGWTLNLEMLFYAAFALALSLKMRPLRFLAPLLGALAVLPLLKWGAVPTVLSPLVFGRNPILIEFLFGIALYHLWKRGVTTPVWAGMLTAAAAAATILVIPWGAESFWRPVVWGVPAFALVATAVSLEESWGGKVPRWMLELGDASYSIYLVQTFALPLVGILLERTHAPAFHSMSAAVAGGLMLSAVAGEAMYRGLELPLIRFFRGRRKAAMPTGT